MPVETTLPVGQIAESLGFEDATFRTLLPLRPRNESIGVS